MSAVIDAWQAALAAEHAAVAGYDVLGPHLDPVQVGLARTDQQTHRDLRDATSTALTAAGQTPVPAEPSYPLPFAVTDTVTAERFALDLESACAAAWRYLIAVSPSTAGLPTAGLRGDAQSALTGSAVRAMRWRRLLDPARPTVAFPGL